MSTGFDYALFLGLFLGALMALPAGIVVGWVVGPVWRARRKRWVA